jgi:hypothetical protein
MKQRQSKARSLNRQGEDSRRYETIKKCPQKAARPLQTQMSDEASSKTTRSILRVCKRTICCLARCDRDFFVLANERRLRHRSDGADSTGKTSGVILFIRAPYVPATEESVIRLHTVRCVGGGKANGTPSAVYECGIPVPHSRRR